MLVTQLEPIVLLLYLRVVEAKGIKRLVLFGDI